jgi:hypothetical protein
MSRFNEANRGNPFTLCQSRFFEVLPVGKSRAQGQLPIPSEFFEIVFGATFPVCHPAKIIVKMCSHIIRAGLQCFRHTNHNSKALFRFFQIVICS